MREIKFRAWNVQCDCEDCKGMWDWHRLQQITYGKRGNTVFNDPGFILMQYTGLKDSKGVEIYEGDIVEFKYANFKKLTRAKVQWCRYGWDLLGTVNLMGWFGHRYFNKCENIGNIYENPELLEV